MDVSVYTTPTCGYCHQAKRFLSELGVEYTKYDVSQDRKAADEMVRLTGQMGVPVILVDGQAIIGFDRMRLQQLLSRSNNRQRPRLGLKVADAGKLAQKPGGVPVFGAIVGSVAPSSPGEKSGIKKGDIITYINQKRINNAADLEEVIGSVTAGSRVPVTFYRGEQAVKSEIAL